MIFLAKGKACKCPECNSGLLKQACFQSANGTIRNVKGVVITILSRRFKVGGLQSSKPSIFQFFNRNLQLSFYASATGIASFPTNRDRLYLLPMTCLGIVMNVASLEISPSGRDDITTSFRFCAVGNQMLSLAMTVLSPHTGHPSPYTQHSSRKQPKYLPLHFFQHQ